MALDSPGLQQCTRHIIWGAILWTNQGYNIVITLELTVAWPWTHQDYNSVLGI